MDSVTIKDIARLAGVSCATVSRVLNGVDTVRPDTRERVLALCRQHGYRRNLLARSLSAGRTGLIGCILPDLDNPLLSEMLLALERYARSQGYHILVCHGRAEDANMDPLFDFLIGHRVDGILLSSSSRQAPALLRRYRDRVPIVLLGCQDLLHPDPAISTVGVDDLSGGQMAASYLHRLGHRNVLYLGAREDNYSHLFRRRSFVETARQLGMSVRDMPNRNAPSSAEAGYRLARQFFFDPYQETAIFAACDAIACGVISAAAELHISIPEDISLMSFDNIPYSALPNIRLTTLDHQVRQVAEAALDLLLSLPDNPSAQPSRSIRIPPVLVERATCRQLDPPQ